MELLENAIKLAAEAHRGQKDKTGQPVILHPLRVMMAMPTDELRIVAVLHDVVEDTWFTLENLQNLDQFDSRILDAVDAITHRDNETNILYLNRCKRNELARQVKLADIADNSSPLRQMGLTTKTKERLKKKYELGLKILLEGSDD